MLESLQRSQEAEPEFGPPIRGSEQPTIGDRGAMARYSGQTNVARVLPEWQKASGRRGRLCANPILSGYFARIQVVHIRILMFLSTAVESVLTIVGGGPNCAQYLSVNTNYYIHCAKQRYTLFFSCRLLAV
jgi:hypothetical protein